MSIVHGIIVFLCTIFSPVKMRGVFVVQCRNRKYISKLLAFDVGVAFFFQIHANATRDIVVIRHNFHLEAFRFWYMVLITSFLHFQSTAFLLKTIMCIYVLA